MRKIQQMKSIKRMMMMIIKIWSIIFARKFFFLEFLDEEV